MRSYESGKFSYVGKSNGIYLEKSPAQPFYARPGSYSLGSISYQKLAQDLEQRRVRYLKMAGED